VANSAVADTADTWALPASPCTVARRSAAGIQTDILARLPSAYIATAPSILARIMHHL
jgi:hypothetical protein